MINFSLPAIIQGVIFLADAIFSGLKIFIPVIFLFQIIKLNFEKKRLWKLTITANNLLLAGGILFCIAITTSVANTWFSEDEFGQAALTSMVTGPHWFQFVLPVICYGLFPNAMWIKKLRYSISASLIIVISWAASYFIIVYFSYKPQKALAFPFEHLDFSVSHFYYKLLTFAILAIITYYVIGLRKKN